MTDVIESAAIQGVKQVRLAVFSDDRGQFMELFRKDWFPERTWDIVQSNRSDSKAGVLRGLHYHRHQVDYWHATRGRIRVGLADLRLSSPTRGAIETIDLDQDNPSGLFIPAGVAHGFYALTDATLTYIVDNYYDGHDELGVAWDDPTLQIAWGVSTPVLSPRDLANPRLLDIPPETLPD
jgi:dTDP-4-dehydrorhamnose 3,5-epimerase